MALLKGGRSGAKRLAKRGRVTPMDTRTIAILALVIAVVIVVILFVI